MTDAWPGNTQHTLVQSQSTVEGEAIHVDWSIAVLGMVACSATDALQEHEIGEQLWNEKDD